MTKLAGFILSRLLGARSRSRAALGFGSGQICSVLAAAESIGPEVCPAPPSMSPQRIGFRCTPAVLRARTHECSEM